MITHKKLEENEGILFLSWVFKFGYCSLLRKCGSLLGVPQKSRIYRQWLALTLVTRLIRCLQDSPASFAKETLNTEWGQFLRVCAGMCGLGLRWSWVSGLGLFCFSFWPLSQQLLQCGGEPWPTVGGCCCLGMLLSCGGYASSATMVVINVGIRGFPL